ncbi:uncharacterized protein LOC100837551 [Brachypodium distachyon]|uniref:Uncharacterized protein n=1 Tax=Brachypodium distachyon TaxID=15368 RepID=I1HT71_BRADI|nr:uncharacterized protein LOC100837551 [Brachypodium distachyon]KQK10489.1 hypothetical protein BRADI_2g54430v3 [Brachypodium distachyon]|eukprot:XP_003564570.1 uncharacterized protein LOC100837551 [Brachypodium distachyon]
MSQRPGRHQRRASQSVFSLPENFASLEDVPADGGEQRKPAAAVAADASGEQQQQQKPAGRHRRAMSMAVAASLDMIAEDIGSYKYGA